jgi:hypothetical protein
VKLEFLKPPRDGAYRECSIQNVSWDKIPIGGCKWYDCT